MPPGTGDIQITACQTLQLSGAVVVTTPHRLATEDVRKGIQMFEGLKVPVLAVVSVNMRGVGGGRESYCTGLLE